MKHNAFQGHVTPRARAKRKVPVSAQQKTGHEMPHIGMGVVQNALV